MVEFILRDFFKVTGEKITAKKKNAYRKTLHKNYTFERRAIKIKKIFERNSKKDSEKDTVLNAPKIPS